jgi:DNA-binding NarL/FixJ family response regulator
MFFDVHQTDADGDSAPPYRGPERRRQADWLVNTFDEIDFGIILLTADNEVFYANRSARLELARVHPLKLTETRIVAADARDAVRFDAAFRDAVDRGLRRLVILGVGVAPSPLAVIPIDSLHSTTERSVMLMLSRRASADPLAIQVYARAHGLTSAETRVLVALCSGQAPLQIARDAEVEISTVRTQIISIRQKTGARNLRSLMAQVATLPPFMGILGRSFCAPRLEGRHHARSTDAFAVA